MSIINPLCTLNLTPQILTLIFDEETEEFCCRCNYRWPDAFLFGLELSQPLNCLKCRRQTEI